MLFLFFMEKGDLILMVVVIVVILALVLIIANIDVLFQTPNPESLIQ